MHIQADENMQLKNLLYEERDRRMQVVEELKEEYNAIMKSRASQYLQDMDVFSKIQVQIMSLNHFGSYGHAKKKMSVRKSTPSRRCLTTTFDELELAPVSLYIYYLYTLFKSIDT